MQHGMIAFNDGQYSDAADRFTDSITTICDLSLQTTLSEPRLKIFTLVCLLSFK